MGSWYIETLIRNSETIKSNIIYKMTSDDFEDAGGYTLDFTDDDYNNLLLVEKKIKDLIEAGVFTENEIKVLKLLFTDATLNYISSEIGYKRRVASKMISTICGNLASVLGDGFTDIGYLQHMKEKYNLSDDQLEKAKLYMASNRKNFNLKGK